MDALQTARSWVANGFSVIPIEWRSKRPAFDALKMTGATDGAGRPVWETFKGRQASDRELWLWFAGPRRNLGVVTGWHGLTVLDFDQRDAYDAWLSWASIEGGQVARIAASTYRVYSARGVHVYVVVDEPVESYKVPGIDIKGKWGYVLCPPSTHPCGHEYHAIGTSIVRCERLKEVFPFERPTSPIWAPVSSSSPTMSDPWEAASRAVECGGEGAVLRAKTTLRIEDVLHLESGRVRQTILCPLHGDHNPSLHVDLAKQRFKCFGCGARGDALDLFAALHNISLREAIAQVTKG